MKRRNAKSVFSLCLAAAVLAGSIPAGALTARAAGELSEKVESGLEIQESEINQLLTGDLELPSTVTGLSGAQISYSLGNADARYVTLEGTTLKVTRPYAGEGNYTFTLTATVTLDGESCQQAFPFNRERRAFRRLLRRICIHLFCCQQQWKRCAAGTLFPERGRFKLDCVKWL